MPGTPTYGYNPNTGNNSYSPPVNQEFLTVPQGVPINTTPFVTDSGAYANSYRKSLPVNGPEIGSGFTYPYPAPFTQAPAEWTPFASNPFIFQQNSPNVVQPFTYYVPGNGNIYFKS